MLGLGDKTLLAYAAGRPFGYKSYSTQLNCDAIAPREVIIAPRPPPLPLGDLLNYGKHFSYGTNI